MRYGRHDIGLQVIISIEAAAPTWLMQQMNLHCNLPSATMANVHAVCYGLAAQVWR